MKPTTDTLQCDYHPQEPHELKCLLQSPKQPLTLEQVAQYLIHDAEEVANHYEQVHDFGLEQPGIHGAMVYAYIVAGLRMNFNTFRSADVVYEAMKQRFEMSEEDFAIDILGG